MVTLTKAYIIDITTSYFQWNVFRITTKKNTQWQLNIQIIIHAVLALSVFNCIY